MEHGDEEMADHLYRFREVLADVVIRNKQSDEVLQVSLGLGT